MFNLRFQWSRRHLPVQICLVFPYSLAQLDCLPHLGTRCQKRKLVLFPDWAVLKVKKFFLC